MSYDPFVFTGENVAVLNDQMICSVLNLSKKSAAALRIISWGDISLMV